MWTTAAGQISVEPAGNYSIEARNGKGDVEVTLPPDSSATVDGHTHNGDIVTDFPLAISGDESKTISGRIGGGQSKVTLSADVGDLAHQERLRLPGSVLGVERRATCQRASSEGAQKSTRAAGHTVGAAGSSGGRKTCHANRFA